MSTLLILTLIGDDRPGLISAISETVAGAGGTWLESRLARLGGKFAGIALVSLPDDGLAAFEAAVGGLAAKGLRVSLDRAGAAPAPAKATIIKLEILGHDRPGIVRDVTQVLTGLGVNVEDFTSEVESAAFSGIEMFRATAWLRAPEGLSRDDLRKSLERLAGEIMVDLSVSRDGSGA
jgi:glycine cleavage system regulatory protein